MTAHVGLAGNDDDHRLTTTCKKNSYIDVYGFLTLACGRMPAPESWDRQQTPARKAFTTKAYAKREFRGTAPQKGEGAYQKGRGATLLTPCCPPKMGANGYG